MRKEFNSIKMDGKIVIGEGEMDEAPMLFIGEKVGTKKGQKLDIAVDPLEGLILSQKIYVQFIFCLRCFWKTTYFLLQILIWKK